MYIHIEYCMQWNYEPRALSLRESLEKKFGAEVSMEEGSGGVFEVNMYNEYRDAKHKLFSKKESGRFPEVNEIEDLIEGIEEVS